MKREKTPKTKLQNNNYDILRIIELNWNFLLQYWVALKKEPRIITYLQVFLTENLNEKKEAEEI